MRSGTRWKLFAGVGAAGAALALSLSAFAALAWQVGPLMGADIGFSASHDERAFGALSQAPTAQARAEAGREDRRALALSPYDNAARLRLAYIETLRGGVVTPFTVQLLGQSYDLVPFDHTIAGWRIGFALEHWGALPPDLRREVFTEAMAFGTVGSHDVDVGKVLQSIRDPQGRLAAALWLHALKK